MAGERRWALLVALCGFLACSTALAEPQQLPRRGLAGRPSALGGAATGGGTPAAAAGRRLQQAGAAAAAAGGRCQALTKELLQGWARNNTVMLAVMNAAQWDFAQNWLHHTKRAGIDYYVVAATDAQTSARLAALGEPCFDRIDEEVAKLGLEWGNEGWRRMTWSKVFVLDEVVDWGFNLVVSDVDVVWFKDPLPLLAQHPHADLIFSQDGVSSRNEPGDPGLESGASPHFNFNTGVYLMRFSRNASAWAHAWRKYYDECKGHDQDCAYKLMRTPDLRPHPEDPRLSSAWSADIFMGILPASLAMSAHSYYLQRLDKVRGLEPYVVHMTWTYNGISGKRSRLRDMGLWIDPPEYYGAGAGAGAGGAGNDSSSFVTVDITLPETPAAFNEWNENEDMISFYLASIHAQLQQAYVGLALALSAGRPFVLPKFQCHCEKIWYSVVRCRVVDAQGMPLPIPCPQDYLFHPGHYDDPPFDALGPALSIREGSFFDNERTPAEVKVSVLVIRPSAELECSDCVEEVKGEQQAAEQKGGGQGSPPVLLVPPALTDAQLLPLLEPYRRYRVWRLSFEGVGATRRAYGGFNDTAAAVAFDKRVAYMTTNFCCRREEDAPRYHKDGQESVKLSLTSEFSYSGGGSSSTV